MRLFFDPGRATIGAARRGLAVLVAALVALPLTAAPTAAAQTAAVEAGGTTVSEIAGDPARFYGRDVMLTGTVEDVLGPRSFVVEDDDLLSDATVAVVTARPIRDRQGDPIGTGALGDGMVLLAGTVHQFNLVAFEDRLGLDLDDAQWAAWAGRPAIIARYVMPWSPMGVPRALPPAASGRSAPSVTVDQITDNPDAYYGRTVTVTGEVAESSEWGVLTLEDTDLLLDEELLVIVPRPLLARPEEWAGANRLEARVVEVTGTVRVYDAVDIERETDVAGETRVYALWDGKPMLVARSIRIVSERTETTPAFP